MNLVTIMADTNRAVPSGLDHRLVRFLFSDAAIEAIGDPERLPASFVESMTSAADGYTSRPLFDSNPDVATVRAVLAGIDGVTEIDVTGEYTLARTRAPVESDGFGTVSGPVIDGWRVVAIVPFDYGWQSARYESGCYAFQLGHSAGASS